MPRVPKVPSSSPYKNYGQQRKAEVQARNSARKAVGGKRPVMADVQTFKNPSKYKRSQSVDAGTGKRTAARIKALGGSVKGVDIRDGITGGEARKVLYARRNQKMRRQKKVTYSI